MTREEKELNCSNCRIGDFKENLCDCNNGFCAKYKGIGTEEDLFKAIEALSVANLKEEFESADSKPIVIKTKTFMRKEDFDKWSEDIKRQGDNIICIPCDAEVVSANEVVRCKDCRHRDLFSCPLADNDFQKDEDFCSWGERREPWPEEERHQ